MEGWRMRLHLAGIASVMMAAVLGWSACAIAQSTQQAEAQGANSASLPATKATIPDAQVEANVLKALAAAPDLANQAMTTTSVYGVVTLSGSVQTEALRVEAETIVSKTKGVQKVVDEMTLGEESALAQPGQEPAASMVEGSPDSDNTAPASQPVGTENGQPNGGQQASAPGYAPGYGQQQPGYAQQPRGYAQQPRGYAAPPVYGGQEAGIAVTVPAGALVRMRINQTLNSANAKPGETFDGIVVNDVVAGGAVAIPRGATVQGTVMDAKKSGALAGRGELSLQLTQVTLGGISYPIVSDVWGHNTGDKTVQTVNHTAAGAVVGALIGAAVGGGKGAAIGAGAGGALGLGSAAASPSGEVFIPSEGLLTFHLAQPATLSTVSQAEMDRLGQGVPGGAPQQLQRRYPTVYYRPYPYGYPYPVYPYPY